MLAAVTRVTFSLLAGSVLLRKAAARYGLRKPGSAARRFVAGEHRDDAIAAARGLEAQGLATTLDLLGEQVTSSTAALEAVGGYVDLIGAMADGGISRSISVKLTQIGLDVDRATAIDNLRRILEAAAEPTCFVRVDMEGSDYTADTLTTVETLWNIGYRNLGVAIQSALRRSEDDVRRMNDLGISVRLVKGAYRESRSVAWVRTEDVERQFRALAEALLTHGHAPAVATHDPDLIAHTRRIAESSGVAPDRFEFEFLYGIRRDLQLALARDGYRVRIYVPYGREWFPYFMRRLGERPANVAFVLKNLVSERAAT
jgi:proline dehydrogenase